MGRGQEQIDPTTHGLRVVWSPETWKPVVQRVGFSLIKEFQFTEQHTQEASIDYLITLWERPILDSEHATSSTTPADRGCTSNAPVNLEVISSSTWSEKDLIPLQSENEDEHSVELAQDAEQIALSQDALAEGTLFDLMQHIFGTAHPASASMVAWLEEEGFTTVGSLISLAKQSGKTSTIELLQEFGFRSQWAAEIVKILTRL